MNRNREGYIFDINDNFKLKKKLNQGFSSKANKNKMSLNLKGN